MPGGLAWLPVRVMSLGYGIDKRGLVVRIGEAQWLKPIRGLP
jgi:hypothetical protein